MSAGTLERVRRRDTEWRPTRIPAEPLLAILRARGGPAACGVRQHSAEERALCRAAREGTLTEQAADQLLVRLFGLTMWEVYGG